MVTIEVGTGGGCLGKSVCVWGGVAAVDLKDRSCRKEVGNPVVTSVDVQATSIRVVPVVTTTSE